jgi:DNA-binding response OmpR family regulator
MELRLGILEEAGGRGQVAAGKPTLRQSSDSFPQSRIGLMGLGDPAKAQLLHWATECAFLTQSFPLEVEQPVVALAGIDLMVIDAGREPLLAVAECGRLRLGLPRLRIALVGPHDPKLERAGLRAGASWYFCLENTASSPPWEALRCAVSLVPSTSRPSAIQKLGPTAELDRSARVLYIDGERRTPPAAKFDLLCYFLDHAGQAVSARELVAHGLLLPTQVARFRCVIRELRHYLGSAANLIRPVSGYGYRLDTASP